MGSDGGTGGDCPSPACWERAARLKGGEKKQHWEGLGSRRSVVHLCCPYPSGPGSSGEQRPKAWQRRWAVAGAALCALSALGTWIRVAVNFASSDLVCSPGLPGACSPCGVSVELLGEDSR